MPAGSGGDRDCLPPLRRDFRYEASKLRPAPGAGGAAAASLDPTRLAPLPASVTRLEADRAAGRNRALDASPAGAPDRGGSGRRPGPGSCKRLADHSRGLATAASAGVVGFLPWLVYNLVSSPLGSLRHLYSPALAYSTSPPLAVRYLLSSSLPIFVGAQADGCGSQA